MVIPSLCKFNDKSHYQFQIFCENNKNKNIRHIRCVTYLSTISFTETSSILVANVNLLLITRKRSNFIIKLQGKWCLKSEQYNFYEQSRHCKRCTCGRSNPDCEFTFPIFIILSIALPTDVVCLVRNFLISSAAQTTAHYYCIKVKHVDIPKEKLGASHQEEIEQKTITYYVGK